LVPQRDRFSDVLERQCVVRGHSKLFWFVLVVYLILHDLDMPMVALDRHCQHHKLLHYGCYTFSSSNRPDLVKIWVVIIINVMFVPFCRLQWNIPEHIIWFSPVPALSQQLPELHALWYTDRSSRKLHTHVSVSIFQHGSRRFASGRLYLCLYTRILVVLCKKS